MADLTYSTLPVQDTPNDASDVTTPLGEIRSFLNGAGWVDTNRLKDANTTAGKLADAAKLGLTDGSTVRRGKSIIATEESTTSTTYTYLTTPDRVQNIVLPTDGLIFVAYQAMMKESVSAAARAAIFIGSSQLTIASAASPAPILQEADVKGTAGRYAALVSHVGGLRSTSDWADPGYSGPVTTGQLIGLRETTGDDTVAGNLGGGPCSIFAAAGTYDIGIKFKASSGSVTAKSRKLWVWTMAF